MKLALALAAIEFLAGLRGGTISSLSGIACIMRMRAW